MLRGDCHLWKLYVLYGSSGCDTLRSGKGAATHSFAIGLGRDFAEVQPCEFALLPGVNTLFAPLLA